MKYEIRKKRKTTRDQVHFICKAAFDGAELSKKILNIVTEKKKGRLKKKKKWGSTIIFRNFFYKNSLFDYKNLKWL